MNLSKDFIIPSTENEVNTSLRQQEYFIRRTWCENCDCQIFLTESWSLIQTVNPASQLYLSTTKEAPIMVIAYNHVTLDDVCGWGAVIE